MDLIRNLLRNEQDLDLLEKMLDIVLSHCVFDEYQKHGMLGNLTFYNFCHWDDISADVKETVLIKSLIKNGLISDSEHITKINDVFKDSFDVEVFISAAMAYQGRKDGVILSKIMEIIGARAAGEYNEEVSEFVREIIGGGQFTVCKSFIDLVPGIEFSEKFLMMFK